LKKLLTNVNLINPKSAIVSFWCYGSGVENSHQSDCLKWLLLFARRAPHHRVLELLLLDAGEGRSLFHAVLHEAASVLAVSSVFLAGNKVWPP
jgi:hypothetical protein